MTCGGGEISCNAWEDGDLSHIKLAASALKPIPASTFPNMPPLRPSPESSCNIKHRNLNKRQDLKQAMPALQGFKLGESSYLVQTKGNHQGLYVRQWIFRGGGIRFIAMNKACQ